MDAYEPVAKGKGILRLYLNDPAVQIQLSKKKLPIPLTIEGEIVLGKTKDGRMHYFFVHRNPDFITAFMDLEDAKLQKP